VIRPFRSQPFLRLDAVIDFLRIFMW
jgi:hypothetical protein